MGVAVEIPVIAFLEIRRKQVEIDEALHEGEQALVLPGQFPIEPTDLIVLAVGVVVALLGAPCFVAHQQHGGALREQEQGEAVFNLLQA